MNKRTLKKGLAAVFSAFMSISGVDPVFAKDSTNNANNPETITVLYGIGPGSISVTQDGETIKYETTGEQKVLTLTRNEADSIQITATADDGTNVYHFDEYYAGAETDIEYIETPTSTATQEIDFDGTKVVEIAFSDTNAMNAIMPLGAACSQGQYATEGYAGMATFAETQRGTPYLFNTQGFSTYDCSGLVARAAWAINWMEGWNIGSSTSGWNSYLSQNFEYDTYDLRNGYTPSSKTKRGDIVIFYEDASYSSTYHMAIMLDNTNMIGAINGFGQYAGVTSAISVPQWPELGTYGHKDDAPYCRIFHLTNEVPTKVSVEKKSSKAEITDGNSLYSLEGAEYAIYKDSGCTQQVATVTTDATGKGTSAEFSLDASVTTLYAKETKAPANGTYKLNQSVIPFSVSNGHGSFEATDEPLNDPLSIQISKLSSDGTIIDDPASMEGAQFTVKYYTGEYNSVSELAGVAPERTWILETKKTAAGTYGATLRSDYKVGGDDFYYNEYNVPVLYLGTVTIEETKAPAGYTTEGSVSYKIDGQTQTATEVDGVALFKLLNENGSVSFKTANGLNIDNAEITKEEQVIRGSLEIKKSDAETGDQPQGGATNLSAQFTLHNDNNYDAVMRDADGDVISTAEANSDFDYTITTDNNGHWKSADGFLPVGNYTLRESGAPIGYNGTATTFSFSITDNHRTIVCLDTFKNTIIRGGFRVQKNDSDLGATPQGSANLKISFNVVSNNNNPVIVNGQTYNKGDVVLTGTTNDDGYYESAAAVLPYGSYTLNEIAAPTGYTNDGTRSVTFNVTGQSVIIDLTTQITNEVIRGGFTVQKNDSDLNDQAQGAADLSMQFNVVSNNVHPVVVNGQTYNKGDVVFTGTTELDGTYTSANDLLPYGSYTLNETQAPNGYTNDGNKSVEFTVSEDAAIIDLTDDISNEVIRGGFKVQKKDAETTTRPQGDTNFAMTFEIVNKNDQPVVVSGKTYQPNEVVYTNSTAEDGSYQSANDLLPYGNYTLRETVPPIGYTGNGTTSVDFTVSEDTAIIDLSNEINNQVMLGGVKIHKVFTDVNETNWTENEAGAIFAVVRNSYIAEYGSVAEAIAHQYGVTTAEVTDREWLNANLFDGTNDADTINKDGADSDLMTGHEYAVIKTDENGNAETGKDLAYGKYTVAQLASGDDEITVSNAEYEINISGDGVMLELQASNLPQTYFIRMMKRDADTGALVTLNSAEFKIFQLEDVRGEAVNEYVTQKVGSVTYDTFRTTSDNGSSNLPAGTFYAVGEDAGTVTTPLKLESGLYRIEEVATPEGFISADPISAEVKLENISEVDDEGNNFITVTISDPRAYGELTVTKSVKDVVADADLIPADVLQQIEFTLIADEDIINPDDGSVLTAKGDPAKDINGNVVGVFHPNANGEVTISKIALGHYTLTETYIPAELALPAETWDVDFIQPDDDRTTLKYSVDLDIENKPTYIELSKKAVTGDDELPGAQISVIEKATGLEVVSFTSGTEPYSIKGLKRNTTYIMRETITPNNGEYVKATDIEFTVNADGSVKTVVMVDKLVTVTKKDTNGEFVEGAEFTVYDENGTAVDVWTSGTDSYNVHYLTAGETYTVSETVVPDGYVRMNDFTFTVADDGRDQEIDIVNKRVSALKVNTAGEPIEGAQMNVTDADGNVVDSWVSEETEHNINGLTEGESYDLNEVVAADGYVIASSIPFTVTGADDQNIKADQHLEMTDKRVEVMKTDMCGVDIDGAQLTVYEVDADGNIVLETVVDEEGNTIQQPKVVDQWITVQGLHHYVNNLVAGHDYVIVETFVPEGYTKAPDYYFTVADDFTDQTETIVNKQLLISKETVGGEQVEGAIITIIDAETGAEVERFVTGKTVYETSNLEDGKTYIMHEDTTPLGFVKATDVEFTVTDDGVDQTVTMIDTVEEVAKVDQNGDLLKGAALEAVDADGNVIDAWISGRHIVDLTEEQVTDLQNGKYVNLTLEDGRTAKIYVLDTAAKADDADDDTDTGSGSEDVTEDVCEIKYAAPAEPATGITVTDDSELKYTIVIDNADGTKEYVNIDLEGDETTHRLSNLVTGTDYTVREVDEVDGYYWADSMPVNPNGTQDHVTTLIDNIINYRINKVDDEGNPIAGVEMKLEDITDPENPIEVELPNGGITTEEGFDLSGILIAGNHYKITETRTVEGFSMPQVSTMEFVVPMRGSAEWTVINFVNLPNKIAVAKIDNHGDPVEGAVMQILSTKVDEETGETVADEVLYEFTSESDPTDISDYVRGGDGTEYILREVSSPFGYEKISDMVFTVDMAAPGTAQLITAIDTYEHVLVRVRKVDQADHSILLEGAELTLYTADGEIAKTVDGQDAVGITDKNGEINWEVEYAEGMYVQETKAPEGYKLNSNYHEVVVEDDYNFIEVEPIVVVVADEANPKTAVSGGFAGLIAGIGVTGSVLALLMAMRRKSASAK